MSHVLLVFKLVHEGLQYAFSVHDVNLQIYILMNY